MVRRDLTVKLSDDLGHRSAAAIGALDTGEWLRVLRVLNERVCEVLCNNLSRRLADQANVLETVIPCDVDNVKAFRMLSQLTNVLGRLPLFAAEVTQVKLGRRLAQVHTLQSVKAIHARGTQRPK